MEYRIYEATFHTGKEGHASKRVRREAVKSFSVCALSAVVFSILSSIVISVIEVALLLILGKDVAWEIFESNYFMWAMQIIGPYLIAFPVLLLMTKNLPRARYKKTKMSSGEFITVFLISTGVMVLGSFISNIISGVIEAVFEIPVTNVPAELILGTPLWIILAVVVIIGPIVEELIFRKVFIDRMSLYGDRLAIITSSIMFGLFHGNISQLVYATALGCILGYVYTKTRSVKYSAALHMLINFFGTVPAFLITDAAYKMEEISAKYPDGIIPEEAFYDNIEILKSSITVLTVSVVQYACAIAGIVLFIVLTAKRAYSVSNRCEIRLPKRTVFRAVFFNFGMIIFLFVSILTVLLSINPFLLDTLLVGLFGI